jgi:hypothetical protein
VKITVEITQHGVIHSVEFDRETLSEQERAFWTDWCEWGGEDEIDRFDAECDRETAAIAAAGERWRQEAWTQAQSLPPSLVALPHFRRWFDEAVVAFNAEIEDGHLVPDPATGEEMHREFKRFFGARLLKEPAVTAAYHVAQKATEQKGLSRAESDGAMIDAFDAEKIKKFKKRGRTEWKPKKRGGR